MAVQNFAFIMFAGLPLLAWGGILTLLLLIVTAILGYMSLKGVGGVKLQTHKAFAVITIIVGLIHGIVGFLAFFRL